MSRDQYVGALGVKDRIRVHATGGRGEKSDPGQEFKRYAPPVPSAGRQGKESSRQRREGSGHRGNGGEVFAAEARRQGSWGGERGGGDELCNHVVFCGH
jgi:hypothetical protein